MALGKGLGDILPEVGEAYEKDIANLSSLELEQKGYRVVTIPVDAIAPNPFQPRKNFDQSALQELSDSIKKHGLLQPIVVIETEQGYTLIAGERRWRAHKLAKIEQIEAVIANTAIDEVRMRELALIENIQREDLNAMELAKSYAELIEVHQITHEELASIVHKSRSHITNTLRLLSLSAYAQEKIAQGKLTQGHAKVLVGLSEGEQKVLIDSIIGQKLSVREAENLAKRYKEKQNTSPKQSRNDTVFSTEQKKQLSTFLPFNHRIKGAKLEITFDSHEQIDAFITLLRNGSKR